MTGEIELLTTVPGEPLVEVILASLLGMADELTLDGPAVDTLPVEAERETAAAAAIEEPPGADEASLPDDDRWRRVSTLTQFGFPSLIGATSRQCAPR